MEGGGGDLHEYLLSALSWKYRLKCKPALVFELRTFDGLKINMFASSIVIEATFVRPS